MSTHEPSVGHLLNAAEQHKRGTVHTRDLGNPCAECGAPGPTTMTYCEPCMIALLADALRTQGREVAYRPASKESATALASALDAARNAAAESEAGDE